MHTEPVEDPIIFNGLSIHRYIHNTRGDAAGGAGWRGENNSVQILHFLQDTDTGRRERLDASEAVWLLKEQFTQSTQNDNSRFTSSCLDAVRLSADPHLSHPGLQVLTAAVIHMRTASHSAVTFEHLPSATGQDVSRRMNRCNVPVMTKP